MSLTGTFSYDQYGEVSTPLSISNPSAYGSTALNLVIDISTDYGKFITGSTTDAAGVFMQDIGRLRIAGTATQINTVLSTLRYLAAENGNFSAVTAQVKLQNLSGSVLESGTVTLNPNIVTLPSYAWTVAPNIANTRVMFSNTSTRVATSFPNFSTTQPYSVLSITQNGTVNGSLSLPQSEGFLANAVGKGYTLYASTQAINTAIKDIAYIPSNTDVYAKYDLKIYCGTESTPAIISPFISSNIEFYNAGVIQYSNATITEDTTGVIGSAITAILPPIAATYNATLTVDTSKISTLSGTSSGNASVSWNSGLGRLTISGGNAIETKAALASVTATPAANFDQTAPVSVVFTSNIGLNSSGIANIVVTPVNDGPIGINFTATHTFREHDPYSFTPVLSVIDPDSSDTLTVTMVTSISQGYISSANGGNWDSATRTWTVSGNLATVNSALSVLRYIPSFLPANQTGLSISVNVKDSTNASYSGTLTLNCTPAETTGSGMDFSKTWTEDTPFTDWSVRPTVTSIDGDQVTAKFVVRGATTSNWKNNVLPGVFTCTGGTWAVTTDPSPPGGYGSAVGTLTVTGTMSFVNSALGTLVFTPTNNYDSSFSVFVSFTGNAVGDTVTGTGTMTAIGVPDAPVIISNVSSLVYNTGNNVIMPSGSVFDPDSSPPYTLSVIRSGSNFTGDINGLNGSYSSGTFTSNSLANTNIANTTLQSIRFVTGNLNVTGNDDAIYGKNVPWKTYVTNAATSLSSQNFSIVATGRTENATLTIASSLGNSSKNVVLSPSTAYNNAISGFILMSWPLDAGDSTLGYGLRSVANNGCIIEYSKSTFNGNTSCSIKASGSLNNINAFLKNGLVYQPPATYTSNFPVTELAAFYNGANVGNNLVIGRGTTNPYDPAHVSFTMVYTP